MLSKVRFILLNGYSPFLEKKARRYLIRNGLLEKIDALRQSAEFTGISLLDHACLYEFVKKKRPQYFLECGTGSSTHTIAEAMKRFCFRAYAGNIRLVSMESEPSWYDQAVSLMPVEYERFVEIRLSPIAKYQYQFVCGTVYQDIPEYVYTAAFIDGPDAQGMCNMDFIRLLENRSSPPVSALIDNRKTTTLAYSTLLGRHNLSQSVSGMCYIQPVTKLDLLPSRLEEIFLRNIEIIGKIRLD
jgi:hypothetical protein